MGGLQDQDENLESSLSREVLQARLSREKLARIEAEKRVEEKSRELYSTNLILQKVADAVESQRVQLDTILDHTVTAIALANYELFVTRANRKGVALFQLGHDYFAELQVSDLFEDFSGARTIYEERIGEPAQEADQDNQVQKPDDTLHEAVGRRSDGTTFPMEFGLTCMEIEGRQHSVWIFRDISKRKREEAKRMALEHELSQAQKMEALGTLASGVAHEINTPIQYISDNLRFLKDTFYDLTSMIDLFMSEIEKMDDDKISNLAAKVQAKADEIDLDFLGEEAPLSIDQSLDGIEQVASIVNAIKEFSHPGSDEKSEFDLNHLLETTMTVTRNQWKYVADIKTELAHNLPKIYGLPGDVSQVVVNLIVNAADAIDAANKEQRGKITIKTRSRGDNVILSIEDNGCGIPKGKIQRIFDPFFTTKSVGKGTGQGLAIAYTIVKQKHDGNIDCKSEEGKGTTFTITLPITQQEER